MHLLLKCERESKKRNPRSDEVAELFKFSCMSSAVELWIFQLVVLLLSRRQSVFLAPR
jgi:hypothetical protein